VFNSYNAINLKQSSSFHSDSMFVNNFTHQSQSRILDDNSLGFRTCWKILFCWPAFVCQQKLANFSMTHDRFCRPTKIRPTMLANFCRSCHWLKWARQVAFIVDLLHVFSVLRAENDHLLWLSIPELQDKRANLYA